MSLQAPRRRRGRRATAKPKNQKAAIKAYFKTRVGQHGATGNSATAQEDRENCRAAPGKTRQPPISWPSRAKLVYGPRLSRAASHEPDQAKPVYGQGPRRAVSYGLQAASQDAKSLQDPLLTEPSQAEPTYGPGLRRA